MVFKKHRDQQFSLRKGILSEEIVCFCRIVALTEDQLPQTGEDEERVLKSLFVSPLNEDNEKLAIDMLINQLDSKLSEYLKSQTTTDAKLTENMKLANTLKNLEKEILSETLKTLTKQSSQNSEQEQPETKQQVTQEETENEAEEAKQGENKQTAQPKNNSNNKSKQKNNNKKKNNKK